jgi:hypothetical protein
MDDVNVYMGAIFKLVDMHRNGDEEDFEAGMRSLHPDALLPLLATAVGIIGGLEDRMRG